MLLPISTKQLMTLPIKSFEGKVTMPTIAEFEELFALCTREWVEVEGVAGYKFTGPNGNSIFMPAAGSRTQGTTTVLVWKAAIFPVPSMFLILSLPMSYHFNSALATRATTPVYQALAISCRFYRQECSV